MINIATLIDRFEKKLAKKCFDDHDIGKCPQGKRCTCKIAAELKAYMYSVIGSPYYQYTIWDFDGRYGDKQLIKPEHVASAKKKVLEYCWDGVSLDDLASHQHKKSELQLDSKSIIHKRGNSGTNVVIYAPHGTQVGRTFTAALIMREAIKQRIHLEHETDTYRWVDYSQLCYILKNWDKEAEANDLVTANWLVVDNIKRDGGSKNAEVYVSSIIDPFFIERAKDGLPTIFVFKFDINEENIRWEDRFGNAISNIVQRDKTFKIGLGLQ